MPLKIFDFAAADLPYSSSRQPDTKCLLSLAQSFMSCASVSFFGTNGEQREQTTWLFANPVKILTKKRFTKLKQVSGKNVDVNANFPPPPTLELLLVSWSRETIDSFVCFLLQENNNFCFFFKCLS